MKKRTSQEAPSPAELLRALRQVPWLATLPEEVLRELAAALIVRRFRAEQTMFWQGDPGQEMYFLLEGEIAITSHGAGGREVTLARYGAGSFFGDMALLDGQPRSATAEAETAGLALVLRATDFHQILARHPECSLSLLRFLSQRLREANERIQSLAVLTVRQRLAAQLVQLAVREGEPHERGVLLPAHVNHRSLAGWLGASRESITRMMTELRNSDLVEATGRRMIVRDVEHLRAEIEV